MGNLFSRPKREELGNQDTAALDHPNLQSEPVTSSSSRGLYVHTTDSEDSQDYDADPETGAEFASDADGSLFSSPADSPAEPRGIVDRLIYRRRRHTFNVEDGFVCELRMLRNRNFSAVQAWQIFSGLLGEARELNMRHGRFSEVLDHFTGDGHPHDLDLRWPEWQKSVLRRQGTSLLRDQGSALWRKGFDNDFLELYCEELEKEIPSMKKDPVPAWIHMFDDLDRRDVEEWLFQWSPCMARIWGDGHTSLTRGQDEVRNENVPTSVDHIVDDGPVPAIPSNPPSEETSSPRRKGPQSGTRETDGRAFKPRKKRTAPGVVKGTRDARTGLRRSGRITRKPAKYVG